MTTSVSAPDAHRSSRADRLLVALDRRDRQVTIVALCLGSAAAWLYLAIGFRSDAGTVHAMASMTTMSNWTASRTGVEMLMWMVMMVAMMLPAAIPATLVYVAVGRKASREGNPVAPASALVSGYIGIWLLFAVAATGAQWALERLSLLSNSIASNDTRIGGAVLVAAGMYQLTPLKARCLKRCRDPGRLIAGHWRPGSVGAIRMGTGLGLYCLGCCWVLMALVFVGGAMNVLWVAAIATVILLERLAPMAETWGRFVGVAMIVGGVVAAWG